MKVLKFHFWIGTPGLHKQKFRVSATVDIPGLGELEVKGCISDETAERVVQEIEQYTRHLFKITPSPGEPVAAGSTGATTVDVCNTEASGKPSAE